MRTSASDPAFVVCSFFRDYAAIWDRHFPNCARRAHWKIAELVRAHDDGVLFSSVRGKLDDIFGMDEDTCVLRVQELKTEGLIDYDDQHIHASTCLSASTMLTERYDRHMVETAELLYAAAKTIDSKLPGFPAPSAGQTLNKHLFRFFDGFIDCWNEYRSRFLQTAIPNSPARRLKALRTLKTFPYWHVFTVAWVHSHPQGAAKRPYLLVDDFHPAIYEHVGVGVKATTGYVQDMISWGFLRRLTKADGVPKGKFAVRMKPDVFELFQNAYAEVAESVTQTAKELNRLTPQGTSKPGNSAAIIKLRATR